MWRIFRIISEFVEGVDALRDIRPAISAWGSARTRMDHAHYRQVAETTKRLAQMGYTVITGGGPGLMEAANRGAKEGGGKSVGLGIRLPMEQAMNEFCDLKIEFDYFFIRKMMFTKYAAGLLVAPGGFGTMDEFFDTLTLIQTRKIRRIQRPHVHATLSQRACLVSRDDRNRPERFDSREAADYPAMSGHTLNTQR